MEQGGGGKGSGDQLQIEGQEVAFLGAWDFVLLALAAVVLLWVLPRRLLRALQRSAATPRAKAE
jgi:hypothetical protein